MIAARPGQSVASALHGAGVRVLARSPKYRRPRGYTCGFGACGNCELTIDGLPGVAACTAPVRGGEVISRERGWPSARVDLLRTAGLVARFLPAGFQFRLFRSHPWLASRAAAVMARLAGAGTLPAATAAAPRLAAATADSCDVLVVGGGLSGCAAALAAAQAGATVVLAHRGQRGGRSLARVHPVTRAGLQAPARQVATSLAGQVASHPGITVIEGSALGWYEGGVIPLLTASELIECRPRHLIAATGSYDVPALHPGNDKPGVMLADGVGRLLAVDRVAPGRRAVVLTDSVRGYWLARQLRESGVSVAALIDRRQEPGADLAVLSRPAQSGCSTRPAHDSTRPARDSGSVRVLAGSDVSRVLGLGRVRRVQVATPRGRRHLAADLLCIALGEQPANELALQWRYDRAGSTETVPGGWQEPSADTAGQGLTVVGSAAGWAGDDIDRAACAGARAAALRRSA